MEIETRYIAKNGAHFDDPIKCQEYEERLDNVPGTVGSLIKELEKLPKETYIFGIAMIKDKEGKRRTYCRCTIDIGSSIDSFVNVDNLTDEQRHIINTAGFLADELKKDEDKLSDVQYMFAYSGDMDFKKYGCMACSNNDVWK